MKKWALSAAIAAGALTFGGQATAQQSVADTIAETYMYGIDRNNGQLRRYQFSSQALEAVGTVSNTGGQACEGIDAAGYIPGFANIFALWQDPSDSQNKLLYVSLVDAHAAIVADDLEGGKFTGAVAVNTPGAPRSACSRFRWKMPHRLRTLLARSTSIPTTRLTASSRW